MTPSKPAFNKTFALAAAGTAALHVLWALTTPVGSLNDDAVHILLSRSLLSGRFALPDGAGPVSTPLPGYPALLAPLSALPLEALRFFALAWSWAFLYFSWKLFRKFLPERWAAGAVLLLALNPAWLLYAGAALPDIPYAALSLALFLALEKEASWKRLAALAAAACLLRPLGPLLALACALALGWKRGVRQAALFLACALLPLGLWSLRTLAVAGTYSGHLAYWLDVLASQSFSEQLQNALLLVALFLGEGALSLPGAPYGAALGAGAALLALACAGAWGEIKRGRTSALALALYAALVFLFHTTYRLYPIRYVIPLLPIAWLLAALGARRLPGPKILAALLALACVWANAKLLSARSLEARFWPKTMLWLEENVPPSAGVESSYEAAVMLLAQRRALPLPAQVPDFRHWRQDCLARGVGFLALTPQDEARLAPALAGFQEVYRDRDEGSAVYSLP